MRAECSTPSDTYHRLRVFAEAATDDSPSLVDGSTGTGALADSTVSLPEESEASDGEVQAAVRAVEDDREKVVDNESLVL